MRVVDLGNSAIDDTNSAIRVGGHDWIVGGDDKGLAGLLAQFSDELEHIFAVAGIEVAGWLVSNHEGGIGCQGTGNRYTLLFAARKLIWTMVEPV